jgi:hypothetical protein
MGSINPQLPDGYNYMLSFDGKDSFNFTESDNNEFTYNSDSNIITNGKNLTLYLVTPENLMKLGSREVPSSIWNHVKHVYSNWTAGDNPPKDGRGFGQGAVADSLILDELIEGTTSSQEELLILAESVFNILFATSANFNNDVNAEIHSDGYGLFNYSVGMRDHIRNAGNGDPDSASEIAVTANDILGSFDAITGTLTPTSPLTEFGGSTTIFGDLYNALDQIQQELTAGNLAAFELQLKSNITLLTAFLIDKYSLFRDLVFNFEFELEELVVDILDVHSSTTSDGLLTSTSSSDDSSIQFSIFVVSIVLLPILMAKFKFNQKKL